MRKESVPNYEKSLGEKSICGYNIRIIMEFIRNGNMKTFNNLQFYSKEILFPMVQTLP